MRKINELLKEIDKLNIPEGNFFTPNTKAWAKMHLSMSMDLEKEAEYDANAANELVKLINEWEEFIEEYKEPEISKEKWNIEEIFDKEKLYEYNGYKNLKLKIYFYNATDFMGIPKEVLCLRLEKEHDFYFTLTTNFGEFIGQIATTYIDTNNNPNVENFLLENHLAIKTQFTKHSGFCEYPLYIINPKLLKTLLTKEKLYSYIRLYDFMFDFEEPKDEECEELLEKMTKAFYDLANNH